MSLFESSWDDFWKLEAVELCRLMPYAFVGGSPITTMSFQAFGKGRLAYLSRDRNKNPNPIFLDLELKSRYMYFSPDNLPLAHSVDMDLELTQAYQEIAKRQPDKILNLFNEESRRYGEDIFDPSTHLLREEQTFHFQIAYPSPLHHETRDWWDRVPRLGLCYTVGDRVCQQNHSNPSDAHRASEAVLLLSACHAGNRMITKRIELLFTNGYRWESAYGKDDRIAENIARALCISNPQPTVPVDEDQKLYLIAKLLLSHHLFFPHSPELLAACAFLQKDPNEDILKPHGWEPVEHVASSATTLRDCINRLTSDISLVIRAFGRWSNPQSVTNVSDGDLENEIRRLVSTILGLFCSVLEWNDEQTFVSFVPPNALIDIDEIGVPSLDRDRAKAIIQELRRKNTLKFEQYRFQLSPLKIRANGANYEVPIKKAIYKAGKTPERVEYPAMPWLSKYVRSRVELAARQGKIELPTN